MSIKTFLEHAKIREMDEDSFDRIKQLIFDEYIELQFLKRETLNKDEAVEKIYDFFEKATLYHGQSFQKIKQKYISDLDSVVSGRISRAENIKEKGVINPRARQYYERAKAIVTNDKGKLAKYGFADYSRIMLCLYMAIIENNYEQISDFDCSIEKINIEKILESLKNEKGAYKKLKFEIKDCFSLNRCTFVMVIIMYFYILSNSIKGEY